MGVSDHGPHELNYEEELIRLIHSTSILAVTKLEIMQCAVARSPKACIIAHGIQIPSLLDLGSDVMLLRQSYLEKHLLPKIQVVTSGKAEAHQLFHLTVANDVTLQQLPGIVGWNLIRLSYNVFVEKYGASGFNSCMSRGS